MILVKSPDLVPLEPPAAADGVDIEIFSKIESENFQKFSKSCGRGRGAAGGTILKIVLETFPSPQSVQG